jgi:hypothetical protein
MTKLEIDKKIVENLHNLSLDERKSLLDYSLLLVNQKKKLRIKHKTQNFSEFLRDFRQEAEVEPRNMIEELLNNPLKVYDSKPLSRDEIYSRQEQPRKKITVHTFHGDGLKPGINLNNSSELQDVLDEDRIA